MDLLEENKLVWEQVKQLHIRVKNAEDYFNFLRDCVLQPDVDVIQEKANKRFIDMFHSAYMGYVDK